LKYLEENESKLAGLTPDQLVEYQRSAEGVDRYTILDALQRWVDSQNHLRVQSKQGYYNSIRSFFLHNRAALPRDPSYIVRSETPPVRSKLDVDVVRSVVLSSKPKYQAVFMVMLQGGLDQAGLLHWDQHGLESTIQQLREKPFGPVRIDLPGRKASKNVEPYYTFIGRDACEKLQAYLKLRGTHPGPIFGVSRKALLKYWTRQLKRLGYIEQRTSYKGNRYGLNPHRLRGVFRSRWRLSGVDSEVAEFFLGHSIDKLGYDRSPWLDPDWYEEKYLKAEPWLNILSEDPEKVHVRELHKLRQDYERRLAAMREEILAEVERQLEMVQRLKREL